jgi:hypothetical protein
MAISPCFRPQRASSHHHPEWAHGACTVKLVLPVPGPSVLVPVAGVGGVPVAVVHVVSVVLVRDGDVPAVSPVLVLVPVVGGVPGGLALVRVVLMRAVNVAVMGVVGVIAVRDGDVPAALAMDVRVIGVRGVRGGVGHGEGPSEARSIYELIY